MASNIASIMTSNIHETLFCNTCSRQFQRKHAYESHILCCPKLFNPSISELPSQVQLYSMIVELNKRCEKMQNEIRSLKSVEIKEKKSVDLYEWLKTNKSTSIGWEDMISKIKNNADDECIDTLRQNSLQKTMMNMMDSIINDDNTPIVVFSHKKNSVYICAQEQRWSEENIKKLRELYNVVHKQLITQVNIWGENKGESLYNDDHLSRIYNGMIEKVLCGTSDDGIEKVFKKLDTELRKKYSIAL